MRQRKAKEGAVMRFGYARVSTLEQNLDRQLEALAAQGIEDKNIFTDKVSGAKEKREGLDDLLSRLREGDSVTVLSFDRLARSTKQLLSISEQLESLGVDLVSLKENIDTSSPQGKLFFTVSSAFAEFERAMIKERQAEGIAIAKAKRGQCGGRPKVRQEKLEAAIALYQNNEMSGSKIAEVTGVSRATLYRELDKRGIVRVASER